MHAERRLGSLAWLWIAGMAFYTSAPVWAQSNDPGFVSGAASQAWDAWSRAMTALIERDSDSAEGAFGDLIWTHQEQQVKPDFMVRYYLSRFIRESAK